MELKKIIEDKIADIKKEQATFDITMEESRELEAKFERFFFGNEEDKAGLEEEAKATKGFQGMRLAQLQDTVERLEESLELDLMHCEKRYVVTDTERLTSPAGFHPDEKVFVQTTIAIHTDNLKRVPASNATLYAHKVN